MPKFNASTAQCHVLTEKEGLLSAVAHDLQLRVTSFSIDADDKAIDARFKADSLKVMSALKDGQPTDALSDKDKDDIEGRIVKDVLAANAHPEIRFVSTQVTRTGSGATIAGNLTLHGVTKPVQVTAKLEGNAFVAEVPIHQPDFGIKPYSAMMGTLKVKPNLRVRVTLPKW